MPFGHKNFGSGVVRIFVFGVLSAAIFYLIWAISASLMGVDQHLTEFPNHALQAMLTAFITTVILSAWVTGRLAREQQEHERELEEVNRKLRELAVTDAVTGAYNHRYFEIALEREWQKMLRFGHALSCVVIDLDNFKRVNDTYGHQAGDFILREVAELLHNEFREIDIVSRYGGEEFAVILIEKPNHARGLFLTVERIRKQIAVTRFRYKRKVIRITASLGGALAPHPKIGSPTVLVHAADKSMYTAKNTGKNRSVVFGL